jgi:hypothetical protein
MTRPSFTVMNEPARMVVCSKSIETGCGEAPEAKLAEWKRLLRSRPAHGQTVLRNLLDGPILIGAPKGDAVPAEAQPNRGQC